MKKILVMLFCMLFIFSLNNADAASRPKLIVSEIKVVDGSASVGNDFVLGLTVTNVEPVCARTVTLNIQANSPFINTGKQTTDPVDVCTGEYKVIKFPMRIDPTAVGGLYPFTIIASYEDLLATSYTTTETSTLLVGGEPEINAHIVNSNPIDVYAGDTAMITVAFQNDGGYQAQNVNAVLSASEPLEVKWSRSTMTLATLNAKQSSLYDFSVEVKKTAKDSDYPMSLEIKYNDQSGSQITKKVNLNFHVKSKALFSVTQNPQDKLFANDNSKVVRLTLENTGTDAAKKLKIKIQPQYPFTSDGSIRYVDDLEPGKSIPVEFVVNVDKDGTAGSYGLDLILDFENDQADILHDTAKLSLNIQKKDMVRATIIDYWYLWIIGALILFFIIKKRVSKKKK